jgi:predicted DNA-binding WGR domain protein
MTVELEYHDTEQNAHKFWRVEVQHCNVGQTDECWQVTTVWGRVGSNGQSKSWSFDREEMARRTAKNKARMKRRKGYLDLAIPTPARPVRKMSEKTEVTVELDAHEKPRVVVTIAAGVEFAGLVVRVDGEYADAHKTADGIAELLRFIVEGYERDEGYRIWLYDVANIEDFGALSRWLSGRPKAQVKRYSREDMLAVDVATEFSL